MGGKLVAVEFLDQILVVLCLASLLVWGLVPLWKLS